MSISREDVISRLNIDAEIKEIAGDPIKGSRKWKCIRGEAHANGDASPSLVISNTGYFECKSCGIKGDIFQLYMIKHDIQSQQFGEVLMHFARKSGMDVGQPVAKLERDAKPVSPPNHFQGKKGFTPQAKSWPKMPRDKANTVMGPSIAAMKEAIDGLSKRGPRPIWYRWFRGHYGVSDEVIRDFGLGWDNENNRITIPVPFEGLWDDKENGIFSDLVNIRRHDILRYCATWFSVLNSGEAEIDNTGSQVFSRPRPQAVTQNTETFCWEVQDGPRYWTPKWEGKLGKVVGVAGHNGVFIYPMPVAKRGGEIWLVGGEFKALLLLSLGINAVTFTGGEGSYVKDLLNLFTGRTVRVVYDIDKAGREGALRVGQALANAGATVIVGDIPPDGLPKKGDITDFLRLHKWSKEALHMITWTSVESKPSNEAEQISMLTGTQVNNEPFVSIKFSGITEGDNVNRNIKVKALISGSGQTPFVVPGAVAVKCERGRTSQSKKCKNCSLPGVGFVTPAYPKPLRIDSEKIVDMTGLSKSQLMEELRKKIGVPPKCEDAEYKIEYMSVDKMIIVPTVDVDENVDDSRYRHQPVYMITDGKHPPSENETHEMMGRIIPEPRNSTYTMAVIGSKPVDGDVFDYHFDKRYSDRLREAIWTNASSPEEAVRNITKDVAENVVLKYGADTMVLVELLSWFAPFSFFVGPYKCHKVCPEFMILGDTRVGKSTTAKDLAKHLGAGRFVDCGANATFVGLVGGNADLGSHKVFTWGVIPTSAGGHLTMDESNKLPLSVWGGLTNLKSDGIASRTTNNGDRKTRANVRFLTLCNPRSPKALNEFTTPLDAAIEVVGTPQDLARIDMLYVAYGVQDTSILNKIHQASVKHRYEQEIARYHLRWAWSLNEQNIRFTNPTHVLRRSDEIIERVGKVAMIAPSEAKFKIGRVAIAIASLIYDYDTETGGVIVNDNHVDLAFAILSKTYKSYLANASIKTGVIPASVVGLLNKVKNPKMLRILSTSDQWTQNDLDEIFEGNCGAFKYEAQLEHGLMKRNRNYFIPQEQFKNLLEGYINKRINEEKK